MSGINMETIKTLEMINMLVQSGIHFQFRLFHHRKYSYPYFLMWLLKMALLHFLLFVHGMMVDEDHHDVLSTLDQYINSEDEYTVRVRFEEDDYMYIEFQLDDGIIEIDENGWYVA